MAAAQEGRLFIDDGTMAISKENIINEVRAYVQRIQPFITFRYRSQGDKLWGVILSDEEIVEYLMPNKRSRKCRMFNKYHLMGIICVLRNNGVYEHYSDRKYDALLEPDYNDSPYRKYLGMGIDQRKVLLKIRKIVREF